MKFLLSLTSVFILSIIIILVLTAVYGCDHSEMCKRFWFEFQGSTAYSSIIPFCKKCNVSYGYTNFKYFPNDDSYLEVVNSHIEDGEVEGGKYFTMNAKVALRDYSNDKTRIDCYVQSEDIIVSFSVDFKEGFEEAVSQLKEDDEIRFRGKYYEKGCGWTDCELLIK